MRTPRIVKGLKAKAEQIASSIDRALGNPMLMGKAAELEENIEEAEKEAARLRAEWRRPGYGIGNTLPSINPGRWLNRCRMRLASVP